MPFDQPPRNNTNFHKPLHLNIQLLKYHPSSSQYSKYYEEYSNFYTTADYPHHPFQKCKKKTIGNTHRPVFPTHNKHNPKANKD